VTTPRDIITAADLEAAGYELAWAQSLPVPVYTDVDGEPYWLRSDLAPWLCDEGAAS
jgi:hypothetical protein